MRFFLSLVVVFAISPGAQASWANSMYGFIQDAGSLMSAYAREFSEKSYKFSDVFSGVSKIAMNEAFEQKQCTLPPENVTECDCFSMMNMAQLFMKRAKVSPEEYQQRYRRAARLHHPDKNGGSNDATFHLNACYDLLFKEKGMSGQRKQYIQLLREGWEECGEEHDGSAQCFRKKVANLHACGAKASHKCLLRRGGKNGKTKAHAPRNEKTQKPKGIQERLVLLLDDSGSMSGVKLQKAKSALQKIMPRLERTPTEVHLVRSKGSSTRAFGFNDDFIFEDIVDQWTAAHATYLWHYLFEVLMHTNSAEVEVIIITDGCDNQSPPPFNGGEGFDAMMEAIVKQTPIRPRFRVYYIGSDACQGGQTHYRDLALASGGSFSHLPEYLTDEQEVAVLVEFAEKVTASYHERWEQAAIAQQQYQQLAASGDATTYKWSTELAVKGIDQAPHCDSHTDTDPDVIIVDA